MAQVEYPKCSRCGRQRQFHELRREDVDEVVCLNIEACYLNYISKCANEASELRRQITELKRSLAEANYLLSEERIGRRQAVAEIRELRKALKEIGEQQVPPPMPITQDPRHFSNVLSEPEGDLAEKLWKNLKQGIAELKKRRDERQLYYIDEVSDVEIALAALDRTSEAQAAIQEKLAQAREAKQVEMDAKLTGLHAALEEHHQAEATPQPDNVTPVRNLNHGLAEALSRLQAEMLAGNVTVAALVWRTATGDQAEISYCAENFSCQDLVLPLERLKTRILFKQLAHEENED